jgi:hypothetical protein
MTVALSACLLRSLGTVVGRSAATFGHSTAGDGSQTIATE